MTRGPGCFSIIFYLSEISSYFTDLALFSSTAVSQRSQETEECSSWIYDMDMGQTIGILLHNREVEKLEEGRDGRSLGEGGKNEVGGPEKMRE